MDRRQRFPHHPKDKFEHHQQRRYPQNYQQSNYDNSYNQYDDYDDYATEDYGYNRPANQLSDDEWRMHRDDQQQQDFYDTVPAPKGNNMAAPPPPPPPPPAPNQHQPYAYRSETIDRNYNGRKDMDQKRRQTDNIRFEAQKRVDSQDKQTTQQQLVNGYRAESQQLRQKMAPKKKDPPANSIRSIINNLKGGGDNKHENEESTDVSRNTRLSTNPFVRGDQRAAATMPFNDPNKGDKVKNVAQVVEKMNNGDWPIRIDDDGGLESDEEVKNQQEKAATKAKQWETLHRKKDQKPSILNMNMSNESSDVAANDYWDNKEERTSVSTDSALCSDVDAPAALHKMPYEMNSGGNQLRLEGEKLMMYFKANRHVLNYLGVGLSERLWQHINSLPDRVVSIKIEEMRERTSESKDQTDLVLKSRPVSNQAANQHNNPGSPQATEVKVNAGEDSKSKNCQGGGRFVKKSAAALIAKKQGMTTDDPNSSTEIIDPRIAREIKQLQEREDELKRCRGMNEARSYEHLNDIGRNGLERSHSSHSMYSHDQTNASDVEDNRVEENTPAYQYGSMPRHQGSRNGQDPRQRFFRSSAAPTSASTTNSSERPSPSPLAKMHNQRLANHHGLQHSSAPSISITTGANNKFISPRQSNRPLGL